MRFDPFRELDRLAEQPLSVGTRVLHGMPMKALRPGHAFVVHLDLPGVGVAGSVPAPTQVAAAAVTEPGPV
jgi:hypothetical protein